MNIFGGNKVGINKKIYNEDELFESVNVPKFRKNWNNKKG